MEISRKWTNDEVEADIFAVRVSADSNFLVCALSNGQIGIYSHTTGRLSYSLEHSEEHFPATSIRFNPQKPKMFVSVSADGRIREWSTRKAVNTWSIQEENQIYALDLHPLGESFATAGQDKRIRIYDYAKLQEISKLEMTRDWDSPAVPGHTNRIFSILFHPANDHLLISAGWDDSIQVWDTRSEVAIRSMFGAHVCSDTLDVHDYHLLTGSWRINDQLQLWDLRMFKQEKVLKWKGDKNQCLVYASRFHPNGQYIMAGGSGTDEMRFISLTDSRLDQIVNIGPTVFALDFTKDGSEVVVGTQKGGVMCFQIVPNSVT
jgi:WD40 repeat protein